jgi:hypothetical protein
MRECQQMGQVRRLHECIKTQAELHECVYGRADRRSRNPGRIGQVLQHRANRLEGGVARQPLDRRNDIARTQIHPADHAANEVVFVGEREHVLGLGHGRRGLHEHGAADAAGLQQGPQIGGLEIAVDRAERRVGGDIQPGVVATRQ